jgi:hypothetical protein
MSIPKLLCSLIILAVSFLTPLAYADESTLSAESYSGVGLSEEAAVSTSKDDERMPPYVPPPSFASRKPQMPEFLLKNKREGWFFTGFPAIGWDPDTGFNIGAAAQIYNNGKKDSPFFRITPYRQSIEVVAGVSTTKTLQIRAKYDSLYLKDTPWRVRSDVELDYNPSKYYFGIGSDGQQLIFPGTGQVFGSYEAYKNALKQQVGGQTNEKYDNYKYTRLGWRASGEYDLIGGWLRPLMGLQVAYVWTGDYTGRVISGATQLPTHLSVDCNSGRAKGCSGGRDIFVKLGVSFDTRNFEPNPNKGFMLEVVSELSPKFLGSSFYYGRLNTDLRVFGKIFDYKTQRLVLAGRFFYQWQFGDVPFYSMNTMAFSDKDQTGLGGFRTIRGYRLDRFIGPVAMMANMELRYTFYEFEIWKQHISLGFKPFLDAGRVFDNVSDTSFRNWKIGGGGGLQLVWNLATVINFDAAWSGEGNAFYMEAGTQF